MDKVQRDFGNQKKAAQKEGEVNINFNKNKGNSEHLKGGEYIDYEEIK